MTRNIWEKNKNTTQERKAFHKILKRTTIGKESFNADFTMLDCSGKFSLIYLLRMVFWECIGGMMIMTMLMMMITKGFISATKKEQTQNKR